MFAVVLFAESNTKTIKVVNINWINNIDIKNLIQKKCMKCFFSENIKDTPDFNIEIAKNFIRNQKRVYKVFVKKIVGK